MADDCDDTVGCFHNLVLQKCLLENCRFAALRIEDLLRPVLFNLNLIRILDFLFYDFVIITKNKTYFQSS